MVWCIYSAMMREGCAEAKKEHSHFMLEIVALLSGPSASLLFTYSKTIDCVLAMFQEWSRNRRIKLSCANIWREATMAVLVALALPEALISTGESPHSLSEGVNSLSPTPNLGHASIPSYLQAGNSCNCPHHFHSITGAWWGGE